MAGRVSNHGGVEHNQGVFVRHLGRLTHVLMKVTGATEACNPQTVQTAILGDSGLGIVAGI